MIVSCKIQKRYVLIIILVYYSFMHPHKLFNMGLCICWIVNQMHNLTAYTKTLVRPHKVFLRHFYSKIDERCRGGSRFKERGVLKE